MGSGRYPKLVLRAGRGRMHRVLCERVCRRCGTCAVMLDVGCTMILRDVRQVDGASVCGARCTAPLLASTGPLAGIAECEMILGETEYKTATLRRSIGKVPGCCMYVLCRVACKHTRCGTRTLERE